MKKNTHILYLPKWYPNKVNRLLGIFIQKYALASSVYNNVSVLFTYACNNLNKTHELEINQYKGVKEIIVYYRPHSLKLITVIRKLLAYRKGLRHILDYQLIHAHVFTFPVFIAYLLSIFKKIPFIVSEHWTGYRKGLFKEKNFFLKKVTFFLANKAACIIPVSSFLKDDMSSCGLNGKYMIVGNVLDLELKKMTKQKTFTFIYIGDVVEENKNVSGIIKAFSQLIKLGIENIQLYIVGDGEDINSVKKIANSIVKKHIVFFGNQSHDFAMNKLQESHVLILNSRFETFSIVCAEAMLCSIPVITTRCGGPESFICKKASILIDVDDNEDLIKAMLKIKKHYTDFTHYNSMKESVKEFSCKNIAIQLNNIYTDVLKVS